MIGCSSILTHQHNQPAAIRKGEKACHELRELREKERQIHKDNKKQPGRENNKEDGLSLLFSLCLFSFLQFLSFVRRWTLSVGS
jgi:hypothetical protein